MRGKYIHQESVSVLNLSETFPTKWVYLSHETISNTQDVDQLWPSIKQYMLRHSINFLLIEERLNLLHEVLNWVVIIMTFFYFMYITSMCTFSSIGPIWPYSSNGPIWPFPEYILLQIGFFHHKHYTIFQRQGTHLCCGIYHKFYSLSKIENSYPFWQHPCWLDYLVWQYPTFSFEPTLTLFCELHTMLLHCYQSHWFCPKDDLYFFIFNSKYELIL